MDPVKIKTRPFSRYAAACTAAVFALSGCPNFQVTVPDSILFASKIRLPNIKRKPCTHSSEGSCWILRFLGLNAMARGSMT